MTPGQVAHDAGGFERKWERMGESQKADWERIAQAVLQAQPTSSEYAQGYAEGFNDGCAPKEQTVQPGSLTAIDSIAKVYCSSYSSPHHIIFSVEGLRKMIKAAQPLPPTEPDNLTIAYMSGFADGKKAAQPVGNKDATIAVLTAALQALLTFAQDIQNAGPSGEGWQSDELKKAIADAEAAIAQPV